VSGKQLPPGDPPSKDGGIPWKVVLWAAVALYAVVFLLVNSEKQEVSFVFFAVTTRLIWLIFLSMLLGAVLAWFGQQWLRRRNEKKPSAQ
jgi:uncharacterized integral membrane protein